jgi:hypothetical protein
LNAKSESHQPLASAMANKTRVWAKWLSGISLALIVLGVISFSNASDVMINEMDPSINHVLELEPGENAIVNFEGGGLYTALRITEKGAAMDADLRLVDSDGELVDGRSPKTIEVARPGIDGKTTYIPVRLFEKEQGGEYRLYNDGSDTLWLVNDLQSQLNMMASPWVLLFMTGCCIGLPIGLVAVILLGINHRKKKNEQQVSGITIENKVLNTDEIYRQYHSIDNDKENDASQTVPGPFLTPSENIDNTNIVEPSNTETDTKDWHNWDEG